eukprot:scaffold218403_cov74-Attheya_sp.AAC.1
MFGEIISQIVSAFALVYMKLSLLVSIFEPVAHVDSFGAALFYSGVIDDAGSRTVVNLERCGGLGMSHIFKDDSKNDTFTGIVKTRAQFSFGG